MIKKMVNIFLKYKVWFFVITILNIMYNVFIWIIDSESYVYIVLTLVLGSFIIYGLVGFVLYCIDERKKMTMRNIIENIDLNTEKIQLAVFDKDEKKLICYIEDILRHKNNLIRDQNLNLKEYEEYIETWAHEIKTPLALMTFVLDNRKSELSSVIYKKLEYSRTKIQEDIERILYYSRLKSKQLDYIFTHISLNEVVCDIINEYKSLIEEQKIIINNEIRDIYVFCDRKGLYFVLKQIISNSIKYVDIEKDKSFITFRAYIHSEMESVYLIISDNGIGAKPYDIPFLFNKGFTGDVAQKKKQSTGMGLYLANQITNNLKVKMYVSEDYLDGFEICLEFPIIKNYYSKE